MGILILALGIIVYKLIDKKIYIKQINLLQEEETFSFYYGEEVLKKLGCHQVPADDLILKPVLLKK